MKTLPQISVPFLLLPVLLVTGPFLPNLIIAFGSVFFIFFFLTKEKAKLKTHFFLLFIFFWIYILFNSLLFGNLDSIKTSFTYLRFGILILIFTYLFENNYGFVKNFKIILFITILFLFCDSLMQYHYGENLLGYKKDSRISSFFGDEKILGSFISKIIPLYIFFYFLDKRKIRVNIFIIVLLFISIYIIVLSNERSALGLFILYVFLLSIVLFDNYKKVFLSMIILISIILTLIFSSELFKKRYVFDLINQFKKTDKPISLDNLYFFTEAHDAMLRTSFNMFKDKPLTGHGTKMFRYKCNDKKYSYQNNKFSCNTHPHNYYIQILAENGIIGFLVIFSLYIFLIKEFLVNLIRKNNQKKIFNMIIIPNLVMLWPFITHGNFFNSWISTLIYLNLSIYICFKYNYIKIINKNEI